MQCSTQQKRLWGLSFSKCDLGPFSQKNLNTWWLCKFSGAYFIRDWRKLCLLQDVVRWSRILGHSPSWIKIQQQEKGSLVFSTNWDVLEPLMYIFVALKACREESLRGKLTQQYARIEYLLHWNIPQNLSYYIKYLMLSLFWKHLRKILTSSLQSRLTQIMCSTRSTSDRFLFSSNQRGGMTCFAALWMRWALDNKLFWSPMKPHHTNWTPG